MDSAATPWASRLRTSTSRGESPFPSPPSHYLNYTHHNLRLLALLKARRTEIDPDCSQVGVTPVDQAAILNDQKDIPDWDLLSLEKPRVDRIR